jgi:hypothetical protein
MSLGPSATFESMDEPIEVVYLIGSKEYKLIQKLIRDMEDAKEREKEKYLESVKQEFIEGKLTFDSPLEAYVEHMNEMKAKEVSKSYSVEPEILSFDEEDENDGG